MTYTSFICFLLISYLVQAKGRNDSTCPKSFSCGNLTDLSYPYSLSTQPDCGIMFLSGCGAKPVPRIQLLPGGDSYNALRNPLNYTVLLEDPKFHAKLRQHKCQTFNEKLSLPYSPSISFEIINVNIHNFIKCNSTSSSTSNITHKMKDYFAGYRMYNGCKGFSIYYKLPEGDGEDVQAGNLPANCSLIRLPIGSLSDDGGLFNMLSADFGKIPYFWKEKISIGLAFPLVAHADTLVTGKDFIYSRSQLYFPKPKYHVVAVPKFYHRSE